MKNSLIIFIIALLITGNSCKKEYIPASVDKIRLSWTDDPATTMTIGWDQFGGENPEIYYDHKDRGQNWRRYKHSASPTREVNQMNMNTRFCKLTGLLPNTPYYFIIKDSEGVSERFWFKTAPDKPLPFTCIVGGDTKSVEPALSAGRYSNEMVAKLKPLFVIFNGDFTTGNGTDPDYWALWLTDWFELTRTPDGRLIPIVPVHGNHESGLPAILNGIFDVPYQHGNPQNLYYSLSFGGDFFHMILLNYNKDEEDEQREWLEEDLRNHSDFIFTLAANHKPFRPHTSGKSENIDQYNQWAYLFYEYGLDIFLDADSHMSKVTFPVKPDSVNGYEGFIRDDEKGTMHIGEGSWGAGYRAADDDKPWTLRSGSFNQIKWLQVFPESETREAHIDIRTVITSTRDSLDQAISHVEDVSSLSEEDVFAIPEGIDLYTTEPYGNVITYPFRDPKILIITGGHGYDTLEFYQMFDSFEGIDFEQSIKPEAWTRLKAGEEYDALVFYDMWQEISEQEKEVFLEEFEKGTGIVFLHHSLCSHQEWPGYSRLLGGKYHMPEYATDSNLISDYRHDITLHVEVVDPEHPVTSGIASFDILDEGYSHTTRLPGIHPLLKTDHPDCDSIIGWTNEVMNSRVVYLMGGHDRYAYENESFRKLVSNAIRWTAMGE